MTEIRVPWTVPDLLGLARHELISRQAFPTRIFAPVVGPVELLFESLDHQTLRLEIEALCAT